MAVTDIRSRDLRNPLAVSFVGLDNFVAVFQDPSSARLPRTRPYFVLVGVPLTLASRLAIAVVLNAGITRFKTFFRVGYYMPVVTSIVAVAVVWRFLLHPDSGLLNEALRLVGIDGPRLARQHHLGAAVDDCDGDLAVDRVRSSSSSWRACRACPRTARGGALDGANAWQRFRYITAARAASDAAVRRGDHRHRLRAVLRGALRDDAGRPAQLALCRSRSTRTTSSASATTATPPPMSYVLFLAVVVLTVVQFRLLGERDDTPEEALPQARPHRRRRSDDEH